MSFDFVSLLAQAASPAPSRSPDPISDLFASPLVFMLCIGVIFYFLMIRPQQKRQKEQQTLISSVKTGDKVLTTSGIHGLVSNVKDSTVIVKIADNVKIELEKSAIATVVKRSESEVATVS